MTFVPADLQLAAGAPSQRRAFLNVALSQEDPGYYRELARYRIALQQKNALLRAEEPGDPELLAVYDRELIAAGTRIVLARAAFVESSRTRRTPHTRASPTARNRSGSNTSRTCRSTRRPRKRCEASLTARLQHVAVSERARKSAVAGPHRDDLALALDGRSLAVYGSQGQQRTAVLALKVAEYAVSRERAAEAPLLLLDDVLSELDDDRAGAFLAGVGDYEQAFVTATHVPSALPSNTHVRVVSGARIAAAIC